MNGPDGPCPVAVPEEDVSDVVDVLLDNVFAHPPEGAGVEVAVRVHEGRAQLTVADGGPGAPQSALDRGRSSSGSTGLGLDITRRVAEAAGGSVALARSDLGGLLVRVSLPLQPESGTRHG